MGSFQLLRLWLKLGLSGLNCGDRLLPVITLVIYFGSKPWDGALSLMELLDIPDERALPFIQDYKVFLIEPAKMTDDDFDKFSTNLGKVLKFMQRSADDEKMDAQKKAAIRGALILVVSLGLRKTK